MRFNTTVTPDITFDEATGEEVCNVFSADVQTSAGKEAVHQNIQQQVQDGFQYSEEDESYQYSQEATPEDLQVVVDSVGGAEAFQQRLQWASRTFDQEMIDIFDESMRSGDLNEIAEAVGALD